MKKIIHAKSIKNEISMMKRNMIFTIALIMSFILQVQGAKINVPDDFTKIQEAINSSVDGDTIIVAPGTYFENVNFRGKNILLTSHYLFNEDVSFINTTIIDGSNSPSPDTASAVIFLSDEKNTAILQGFTITGGKGTIKYDTHGGFFVRIGGGIIIYNSSPTIRHNIIAYNESVNKAGVSHNGGGGIGVNTSGAIISNNIIYKNNSYDGGGAVLGPNPGAIFRNNIIAYNTTSTPGIGGGGLFIFGTQGSMINNTIAYNSSNTRGGIEIQDGVTVNLENCIIYGNKTGSGNAQIGGNGTFNVTQSNIQGGWTGEGNIDEHPMFVDFSPLILKEGSPCIDMGDTTTTSYDWEDPDNVGIALPPALGTLRNDMGAYGGNQYKSMPFLSMQLPWYEQNSIINVPENFPKIQEAINSSVDGDTILVAPGTYYENVNFRGKNILLTSHYLFDEDVSFINTTIIDGSNSQSPDTASAVIFLNDEKNTAILQGFTITGGKGSKLFDLEVGDFIRGGGGVLVYQSSPTIRHNIIAFNESINAAEGRFNAGGGIYAQFSSAIISNNIIYKNNAIDGGGALLGPNPGSIIRNNIIAYNTTIPGGFGGGGLFIRANQGKFINNTIAYNNSNGGGGFVFHNSPTVNIENCIIYDNKTGSSNTQLMGPGTFNITNTNIEGGWAGEGNMDELPLFLENSALILQDGSPCIDMGSPNADNNDWEDLDNPGFALAPALGTLRNDMGAYGGNQYKSMPYMDMVITAIEDEHGILSKGFKLNQNYPNPFFHTTTISYSISNPEFISLKVYDISGNLVKMLVNENQNSGSYSVEFDATSLPGGVYFYQIKAGEYSDVKRLVLFN
jgi:hypothetical protein